MTQARDVLRTSGLMVTNRHGELKPHPAIAVERDPGCAPCCAPAFFRPKGGHEGRSSELPLLLLATFANGDGAIPVSLSRDVVGRVPQ